MVSFERADKSRAHVLSEIAALTFIESHGRSAKSEDINNFITEKYNPETFTAELINTKNNYYLVYYQNRLAGFSNIIYNFPYADSKMEDIAKLECIYILKKFYDLKLGYHLFEFNRNLSIQITKKAFGYSYGKKMKERLNFIRKMDFKLLAALTIKFLNLIQILTTKCF